MSIHTLATKNCRPGDLAIHREKGICKVIAAEGTMRTIQFDCFSIKDEFHTVEEDVPVTHLAEMSPFTDWVGIGDDKPCADVLPFRTRAK